MNLMVDRDGLNKSIFAGKSEPRTQNWRKGSPFYDAEGGEGFTYNPKKAKQSMAKSAYPNGFEFTVVNNRTPITDRIAQYLQQQWAQLGIKMNILTSLNISRRLVPAAEGPGGAMTNFIGIQSFKLSSTYDAADGTNNACGWTEQQQYVDTLEGDGAGRAEEPEDDVAGSRRRTSPRPRARSCSSGASTRRSTTRPRSPRWRVTMDGLGRQQFDPTRTVLAAGR